MILSASTAHRLHLLWAVLLIAQKQQKASGLPLVLGRKRIVER
jgi:hypothetical protein